MPDYCRNRVPGGTFFFTVNLLDRRSDLRRMTRGLYPAGCIGGIGKPQATGEPR
jgi:hypothetical protein